MANDSEEGNLFDLDTVRSLHKTVIALRTALERSKAELEQVRKSSGTMDDKKVRSFDKNFDKTLKMRKHNEFN